VWGNKVYATKQEFTGYLRSKGLSYNTWLARNPGVAPWEAGARPAPKEPRDPWLVRVPLAALALIFVTAIWRLALPQLRPIMPRFPRDKTSDVSATVPRSGKSLNGGPGALRMTRRLVLVTTRAARQVLVVLGPIYVKRLNSGSHAYLRLLASTMRERNMTVASVTFGLLAVGAAVGFALFVVFLVAP
jgi:hypothetical protein